MKNRKAILLTLIIWGLIGATLWAQQASPHLILLTDGSRMSGLVESIVPGTIQMVPASFYGIGRETIRLKTSSVEAIILTQPISILGREILIRSAEQARPDLDCIISNRGDRQYGYLDKTDWFSIEFQKPDRTSGTFSVPMSETRTILLAARGETLAPEPRGERRFPVWLYLSGQDRLRGAVDEPTWNRLRLLPNRQGELSGVISVAVSWRPDPLSLPESAIQSVEPIPSDAFPGFYWLSDLPAAQYKYIPFGTLKRSYFVDQTPDGALLRANTGAFYRHGFFLYASSRLTFLLPESTGILPESTEGDLQKQPSNAVLSGTIARPEGVRQGSIRFRAFYNGKPLGEWVLAASDDPQEIRIPLPVNADKNVQRRLDLVVDFADDDATDDQIILGNLRMDPQ